MKRESAMIVTVEKNLYYIKQYLESTGKYEIYNCEDYIGPVHAFIYEKKEEENFEDIQQSLINLAHNEHVNIRHGVLMINSQNKTPKEIEAILSERINKDIY
ncbi:MAG: YkuS family protein [Cellulosilyticaceae bacterium]